MTSQSSIDQSQSRIGQSQTSIDQSQSSIDQSQSRIDQSLYFRINNSKSKIDQSQSRNDQSQFFRIDKSQSSIDQSQLVLLLKYLYMLLFFFLQGNDITLVYKDKTAPTSNTPASITVPLYEVRYNTNRYIKIKKYLQHDFSF